MTRHKFVYEYEGNTFLGERYPQQEITISSKCDDLNADEILSLFKSYMVACGYAEKSFYEACEVAAQESPYRNQSRDRHEVGEVEWSEQSQAVLNTLRKTNDIKELLS